MFWKIVASKKAPITSIQPFGHSQCRGTRLRKLYPQRLYIITTSLNLLQVAYGNVQVRHPYTAPASSPTLSEMLAPLPTNASCLHHTFLPVLPPRSWISVWNPSLAFANKLPTPCTQNMPHLVYPSSSNTTSKKRSFPAGALNSHGRHAMLVTVAKLRFLAAPTAGKNHHRHAPKTSFPRILPRVRKGRRGNQRRHQPHAACTNRPERDATAAKLWREVYELIETNQPETAGTQYVRQFSARKRFSNSTPHV
jgi:hypothetical protein